MLMANWVFNVPALVIAVLLVLFQLLTSGFRYTAKSRIFYAGVILFLLMALSPLEWLGRSYLFSAHMMQHIFYLLIIPPMLLAGTDAGFLTRTLDRGRGKAAGKILFYPMVSWILGIGSMWIWHIPVVFEAMKHSQALMILQVVSLILTGYIFIWPVYSPVNFMRLGPLESTLYLFSACVGCTVLGILITFAPAGMFTAFFGGGNPVVREAIVQNWGFTKAADQQMAGLIMWVPACIVYVTNIMITLGRWYTKDAITGKEEILINADK